MFNNVILGLGRLIANLMEWMIAWEMNKVIGTKIPASKIPNLSKASNKKQIKAPATVLPKWVTYGMLLSRAVQRMDPFITLKQNRSALVTIVMIDCMENSHLLSLNGYAVGKTHS